MRHITAKEDELVLVEWTGVVPGNGMVKVEAIQLSGREFVGEELISGDCGGEFGGCPILYSTIISNYGYNKSMVGSR